MFPAIAIGVSLGAGLNLLISPWITDPVERRPDRIRLWLRTQLNRAGLPWGIAKLAWMSELIGVGAGIVVWALSGVSAAAVIATLVSGLAPLMFVIRRANRRRRGTVLRWPDAIDQLVASIRAGASLSDALCGLAERGPDELKAQFASFARDYRQSGVLHFALEHLKERCADSVSDRLVEILRLSREVGGTQLVSVLQTFNASLRDDASTRAELAARQSWITNAARLGVAAPWIVLLMLSLRPEARAAYNSGGGLLLITLGALSCAIAYLIMTSIARFAPEPRWSK